MIKATLSTDNKWLKIESNSLYELSMLQLGFTKKINDWYAIKKKNPNVQVEECFINAYFVMPVGLWRELVKLCHKYNYSLYIDGVSERICDGRLTRESYNEFIDKLFAGSKIKLRDYQREAAFYCLYYRRACIEVSTSGGKTMIAYIIFKYLRDVCGIKQVLFITPNTNLTTQSKDKFLLYEKLCNREPDWTYLEMFSGAKKKKNEKYDEDIIFGNYQTLRNKKHEFFVNFGALINDETQHGTCTSIRTIFSKCPNAEYRIGMSGTLPAEDSYDSFVLQANIGPYVYKYVSRELIKEGYATPVHVHAICLNYLDNERKLALYNLRKLKKANNDNDTDEGLRLLNLEKEQARNSEARFRYICNLLKKTTKNTLVIFTDVQNQYGWRIYNNIKEFSDKNVYYIDGNVSAKDRALMIEAMENDLTGNTVIVASIGCFSEGIDICNLWNIFLVETTKSDGTLRQILGRGMRQFEGKDKTMFIDIIDDFRYYPHNNTDYFTENYLYRHGVERRFIYEDKGFPYKIIEVNLENTLF